MIRVGWLPARNRVGRRTPTYTRRRKRAAPARRANSGRAAETSYTTDMIFDQRPEELPVATLQARSSRTRFLIAVQQWFQARWQWFRPRTIPVLVAFAGMLAILESAAYLRKLARETPEQLEYQHRGHRHGHARQVAKLPAVRLDLPDQPR